MGSAAETRDKSWPRGQFLLLLSAVFRPKTRRGNWFQNQFISRLAAVITVIGLAGVVSAAAEGGAPALSLSTTTAQLGVPVAAVVVSALEPDLEASTTDTFAIALAGQPKPDPKAGDGAKDWPLQIIPLAIGKLDVEVKWKQASAPPATATLMVPEPNLPPDADVADIKKPVRARPALWPWLLALLAAAAAWWWWKNRKPATHAAAEAGPAPDDRPADVIALEALAALEASGLWGQGQHKEFYARLTDALRAYLERRFGMPALKLTTWELARQLREAELERGAVQLFKTVFDRADLVKFAKIVPEAGAGPLDLEAARKLVAATAAPRDAAAPAQEARP